MSLKLKGLGLALLAATAISAFGAMNASATVTGHFTHDGPEEHALVNQRSAEESVHQFHFTINNIVLECKEFVATGTVTKATVTQVDGSTEFIGCHTEGQEPGSVVVQTNGCFGRGTSNSTGAITSDLVCPAGKTVTVAHPNCTMSVPPQSGMSGFTVFTTTVDGKHAITLGANVKYTLHYESGFCIFLGTTHTFSITGSTIIRGTSKTGNYINITST